MNRKPFLTSMGGGMASLYASKSTCRTYAALAGGRHLASRDGYVGRGWSGSLAVAFGSGSVIRRRLSFTPTHVKKFTAWAPFGTLGVLGGECGLKLSHCNGALRVGISEANVACCAWRVPLCESSLVEGLHTLLEGRAGVCVGRAQKLKLLPMCGRNVFRVGPRSASCRARGPLPTALRWARFRLLPAWGPHRRPQVRVLCLSPPVGRKGC